MYSCGIRETLSSGSSKNDNFMHVKYFKISLMNQIRYFVKFIFVFKLYTFSDTYYFVIVIFSPFLSQALKDISSITFYTICWRRLAPRFSVFWFISNAYSAIFLIASCSNTSSTFYVFSKFTCCMRRLYSVSVNILTNYSRDIGWRLTLIGSLPSNSGIKSYTFAMEKDPLAINNI